MRLRTVAGAYAGEIRAYPYLAGLAALRTGMAMRLEREEGPQTVAPPLKAEIVIAPEPRRKRRASL